MHYFSNMANYNYSETGHRKVELVLNILAYLNIIRHIQELSRDIQIHSEVYVTLEYSEPCHIQNQSHIQNTGIFRTTTIFTTRKACAIECFTKIMQILFCFISNMASCDTLLIPVAIRLNLYSTSVNATTLEKSQFSLEEKEPVPRRYLIWMPLD